MEDGNVVIILFVEIAILQQKYDELSVLPIFAAFLDDCFYLILFQIVFCHQFLNCLALYS